MGLGGVVYLFIMIALLAQIPWYILLMTAIVLIIIGATKK
jgi:hypothetical protein